MTTRKTPPPTHGIEWTRDYEKFVMHTHNRVLMGDDGNRLLRKDLVGSMKSEGFRPEEPIVTYANDDGTYTIIDGHNRLIAAQSLGIEVAHYWNKRNGKAEWTPIKSSTTKKQWTAMDVCRAYASEGSADYAELLDYIERTGIKLAQASSVLFGQSASSGNAIRMVRHGAFQIRSRMNGEILASLVETAAKFINWATDDRLVNAFSVLMFVPGFSPNTMKEKIGKYHEFMEKRANRDGMIEMLDHIYNRHSKNRLELAFEAKKVLAKRSAGFHRKGQTQ